MERETPENSHTINVSAEKIKADMETAIKNGVHIDVAVNPFINEEERMAILSSQMQDPEWD